MAGLMEIGTSHRRDPSDVIAPQGVKPEEIADTFAAVDSPGRAPYDPPARGLTRTRVAVRRLFVFLSPYAWADPSPALGHAGFPQLGARPLPARQLPETRRANIPRPAYQTVAEVPGLEGDWT